MSVHVSLETSYHQQDNDHFCGEACAQMILAQRTKSLVEQPLLSTEISAGNVIERGWATAPDGLTKVLNDRLGATPYAIAEGSSADDVSRTIVSSIHDQLLAPALVFGSKHWVLVRGYTASEAPDGPDDTTYSITGFDINNPFPVTPAPGPPAPHAADDLCGTGGFRGVADEHISYNTWQTDYMTGITQAGHWQGKFIAVCAAAPPPVPPHRRRRTKRDMPYRKPGLVPSSLVDEFAQRGLENAGLKDRDGWRQALDKTCAVKPALVQRLDRRNSFYWMTPLARSDQTCAYANIDASTGEFQQARAARHHEGAGLLTLNARQTKQVLAQQTRLLAGRGEHTIQPEFEPISRHWMWTPCLESLSPYYPFKVFRYGSKRLFVRSDGRVFSQLTAGWGGLADKRRVVAR